MKKVKSSIALGEINMNAKIEAKLKAFNEWTLFVQSLRDYAETVWESSIKEGKWSMKSLVSHMMMWDKYFYEEAIEKIALQGELTVKHQKYKVFNNNAIEYGKTVTTHDLIDQAIEYRKKIINTINNLTSEEIERQYVDGDGKLFKIEKYIKDFLYHDKHHIKQLKEYLSLVTK